LVATQITNIASAMFLSAVQPSIVSLFSSTGSDPLQLCKIQLDASLPSDSCVHLLHDKKSLPLPPAPAILIPSPSMTDRDNDDTGSSGYSLNQTVLQIQSPTIRTTYIQCPPVDTPYQSNRSSATSTDLGIKHPWMHVQVRNMGREWSFEVGLVDQSGRMGIIRLSTFQVHTIGFLRFHRHFFFFEPCVYLAQGIGTLNFFSLPIFCMLLADLQM